MIKTFKDRATKRLYNREFVKKYPAGIQQIALRKLRMIDSATNINDLRTPPANRLEKLKGNRTGQYSIRINDKWRLCFVYKDRDVYDIEITDYH